jgi:predicted nicotinamide N-methyase
MMLLKNHLQTLIPSALLKSQRILGFELALIELPCKTTRFTTDQVTNLWEKMPFWGFAWASGQVLANYLLQHPEKVKGKRVLDLGCGAGLVALAAKKAGAISVSACDIDYFAQQACIENAKLNNIAVSIVTNWSITDFDIIVAADIFYDQGNNDLLETLLSENHVDVLLAESHGLLSHSRLGLVTQRFATTLPKIAGFDEEQCVKLYGATSESLA